MGGVVPLFPHMPSWYVHSELYRNIYESSVMFSFLFPFFLSFVEISTCGGTYVLLLDVRLRHALGKHTDTLLDRHLEVLN